MFDFEWVKSALGYQASGSPAHIEIDDSDPADLEAALDFMENALGYGQQTMNVNELPSVVTVAGEELVSQLPI